jgi:hypothetical protein
MNHTVPRRQDPASVARYWARSNTRAGTTRQVDSGARGIDILLATVTCSDLDLQQLVDLHEQVGEIRRLAERPLIGERDGVGAGVPS